MAKLRKLYKQKIRPRALRKARGLGEILIHVTFLLLCLK